MKQSIFKLSSLLLIFAILINSFLITGCQTGNDSSDTSVKTNLLSALNSRSYDDYLDIAYPSLRKTIEEERTSLTLTKDEYMEYIAKKWYPEDVQRICEATNSFATSIILTDNQLENIMDEFISSDDYVPITYGERYTALIKDISLKDSEAKFYELTITILKDDNDNYYFSDYEIASKPLDKNAFTTEIPTTENQTTTEDSTTTSNEEGTVDELE